MNEAPFAQFLEIFRQMTPDHRQRLIDAHKEFTRLRCWCEAKGEIEVLPGLKGIKVLRKTNEVKKLKKVVDFLKPGKFQWLEKGGIVKRRKKSWAES